jgi:hypothetical protein
MFINKYEIKSSVILDHELKQIVEQLCESKVDEFELLGYTNVFAQDIWDCVSKHYTEENKPPLHQIVSEILSLKSSTFMSWLALFVFKEGT